MDHYPRDRVYLDALAAEARGIVRGLRNHPSLSAWCGGNEINPQRERLPLDTLAAVLAEEDPVRPWIPASPCDGDLHHWQVWHGFAPWTDLAGLDAPFMSEFGLQALPDAVTVAEMFPDGVPASLSDPRWVGRKAQIGKLRHYAGSDAGPSMVSGHGLAAAIAATQRAQAAALQVGIESCRLRRETLSGPAESWEGVIAAEAPRASSPTPTPCSPSHREATRCLRGELQRCGGVAFWQFNEPWPAVSWSVIDRAGRRKAAYEMLRRAYQPILIAARFPWRHYTPGDIFRADIWLVNDGPAAWQGCCAEALLDGMIVWKAKDVALPPACVSPIGELAVTLDAAPHALVLDLRCGEITLASNRYDLAVHLPGRQPRLARMIHQLGERLLEKG